jgi:hypothetical protein
MDLCQLHGPEEQLCYMCYHCILTKVSRIVNLYGPAAHAELRDGLRWLCPICFYGWLCQLDEQAENGYAWVPDGPTRAA